MIITEKGNLIFSARDSNVKEDLTLFGVAAINPRYIFFPFWSWRIPTEIHEHFECVIFHMTDVPYGRGGQPYENLIARWHKHTMLSAIKCVEEWDAGDVYMKVPLELSLDKEAVCNDAHRLIVEVMIPFIEKYQPTPCPQIGPVVEFKRFT